MKELEKPTGNLPKPKTDGLFCGTLKEIARAQISILKGDRTIDSSELELSIGLYSFCALETIKMLRRYKDKMKPDHPAIAEFELSITNLLTSINYISMLRKEYMISRQRNADLELALFKERLDKKELEAELDRLRKQNETLIAGL